MPCEISHRVTTVSTHTSRWSDRWPLRFGFSAGNTRYSLSDEFPRCNHSHYRRISYEYLYHVILFSDWPWLSATSNSKPCAKLTLHCNHRSGHLKTEQTESLFLLRRHLGNWPCSKHEKRTAGSTWETWTVAAADGVRLTRVRWEMDFLLTFETAPFFWWILCIAYFFQPP
jgi:hypothetical protein